MTMTRLYKLAYDGALEAWANEKRHLDNIPDNAIAIERERRAWEELQEIGNTLAVLERGGD